MFERHYPDWNQKRTKFLIDFFSHKFFAGKTVLDLGTGHGDLGGAVFRLGSRVTCCDVRKEHLQVTNKKFPGIAIVESNLDVTWPFTSFDVILDLGLLLHLKNWEGHLRNVCNTTGHLVLETAVCDGDDPELCVTINENKNLYDRSYTGFGSYPTAAYIERVLTQCGMEFKRFDLAKLNSKVGEHNMMYDWKVTNSTSTLLTNRRFWIANKVHDVGLTKPALPLVNNTIATEQLLTSPTPVSILPPLVIPAGGPQTIPAPPPVARPKPPPGPRDYFIHAVPTPRTQKAMSTFRLFYNYYQDPHPERKKEIDTCLANNLENKLIEVVILDTPTNPTYNYIFEQINKVTDPDDINIFCNSDIYLDQTIALAKDIQAGQMFALTCWDVQPNGTITFRNIPNSQDTWIVRGKVEVVAADFKMGKYYCDNRLVYEFIKAGYKVFNPSKSIKTYHLHNSGIRRHGQQISPSHPFPPDAIPGPHVFVAPTELQNV